MFIFNTIYSNLMGVCVMLSGRSLRSLTSPYMTTNREYLKCKWFLGPETWSKSYPAAGGARQSPVDICPPDLQMLQVKKLSWQYIPENEKTVTNSGHSWVVNVDGTGSGRRRYIINSKHSRSNIVFYIWRIMRRSIGCAL